MDARSARRTIAGIRCAVGVGSLLAPRAVGRAMGVDVGANPALPYVTRMFGAREIYMAAPFLMPSDRLDEAELASRAVPVDAADAVAAVAAGLAGYLPWRAALPGSVIAVVAAYLGTIAARPSPQIADDRGR